MRKMMIAALTPALLAGFASAALAGETLDRVMKNKLLVEVTDQAYPPFSYIDDSGEVVGFDIDISKEIAKRLGVDYKVETPSWEIIVAGNWNGRWDICVCSMTPTAERAQVLDFVNEYYESPAVIAVNVDNTDINSAADLNGKKVSVQVGTKSVAFVKQAFPQVQLVEVEKNQEMFNLVDIGRADALVTGKPAAFQYMRTRPGLQVLEPQLTTEEYGMALRKDTPEPVVQTLYKALTATLSDPAVRAGLEAQSQQVSRPLSLQEAAQAYADGTAQFRALAKTIQLQPQ